MSEPLRLVVFDVDGTLVDSRAHIVEAMQSAFLELGLEAPTREAVLHGVGLSLPEYMAQLVPEQSSDVHAALADQYRSQSLAQHMAAGPDAKAILYPGIRKVLDTLHRDHFTLLATATGMSRRGLDRIIAQHGLEHHFESTQVADTHPSKPHPSMIHAALSETGVLPNHTVMIGDTSYDIQMGKSAGVGTIGVTWGNHPYEYLAGADQIVETADELMCTLNAWIEELT